MKTISTLDVFTRELANSLPGFVVIVTLNEADGHTDVKITGPESFKQKSIIESLNPENLQIMVNHIVESVKRQTQNQPKTAPSK